MWTDEDRQERRGFKARGNELLPQAVLLTARVSIQDLVRAAREVRSII